MNSNDNIKILTVVSLPGVHHVKHGYKQTTGINTVDLERFTINVVWSFNINFFRIYVR
jgi:hypothetical protein